MNVVRCARICLLVLLCFALRASAQTIAPPLHTSGTEILDSHNTPVHLLSVNWYGFDQKELVAGGLDRASLDSIADQIAAMGFNSVRLPWANETIEHNPVVAAAALRANPALQGKRSLDGMDAVIAALTHRHVMVILDNHMSDADWCCNVRDGNALWYNERYPEASWIADWKAMAARYAGNPWVVGADLRNELRGEAAWGGDAKSDWRAAAERGGNAVLSVNPKLLIFVEGPGYSTHMAAVAKTPPQFTVPHRLVLSPHAYSIGHNYASFQAAAAALDNEFAPLLHADNPQPIWVGEFGACTMQPCRAYGVAWLGWFAQWARANGISNVSYWALNATESSGRSRTLGNPESYGLLSLDWQKPRDPEVLSILRSITTASAASTAK